MKKIILLTMLLAISCLQADSGPRVCQPGAVAAKAAGEACCGEMPEACSSNDQTTFSADHAPGPDFAGDVPTIGLSLLL
ncbi:hypothetical protein [Flavihumibacter petaseus]|uniref:hypothetical protein n=1 Tax=Flavihumibacter petaseus TaxID=549295 RepID=UPI0012F95A2A|nr:hypothetical protein [Flavihumibacter petaseus]